jgi:hypothetical protein
MKRLILLFAFLAIASVSASASPVSLTSIELQSFAATSNTGAAPVAFNNLLNGNYSVQWDSSVPNGTPVTNTMSILIPMRGTTGDIFSITLINNNGNPWDFTVSINNGFAGTQSSGPVSISNNGGSSTFSFVLGANGLQQVSITVGATIPIAGTDRGAEYQVTNVPEPTSMLLLGSGLVGLAGAARRRFRSPK